MKKTFVYKVTKAALWVLHVFGASAFLLTVMALCGVPMNFWVGVCTVLPGWLIIQGLIAIFRHELRKMKKQAFIDHHVAELKKLLEEMESDEQEEKCRFKDAGRCTFGNGAPECAHEKKDGGKDA